MTVQDFVEDTRGRGGWWGRKGLDKEAGRSAPTTGEGEELWEVKVLEFQP